MLNTVIVSDLHYGDKRCNMDAVAQLFGHIGLAKNLIVAGDVLDGWVTDKWDTEKLSVLLNSLRSEKITILPGNHDPRDLLMLVHPIEVMDEARVETNKGVYRVIHGHQYDHLVHKYSVCARVCAWVQQLILKRTGWDMQRLLRFSVSARNKTNYFKRMVGDMITEMDTDCDKMGCHGIICGHTHYPVRVRRNDSFDYVNCGDLVESLSYVQVDNDGEISLCSYFSTYLLPA